MIENSENSVIVGNPEVIHLIGTPDW